MSDHQNYRPLTEDEVLLLQQQGCAAEDWSQIEVHDDFLPERIRNVRFCGCNRLGSLNGHLDMGAGVRKPSGIENACLADCRVGDNVRIANIGVHLAHYNIGDDVVIENVGTMECLPGAAFGNGVEIEPLNEGGGREVVLFNRLDSQFAHLLCLHRYRPRLIDALQAFAASEVARVRNDRGSVAAGARIRNVKQIRNVNIGECAALDGATLLDNGTVLSSGEAPTRVGADVQADDFIIAEGTHVTGGAIVSKSFVGQGCRIGKQFSSEGSLFFANGEGFHGEACSVFAGPYSVTHHKSTLLIAGLFSFYNAGSGTNQSNHLYKLGPVHEGKLERGCKTGSFSYLMWPCRVGPFSVVLGKHTRTFDTGDFPFSYLEAMPDGRCLMTPGFNLTTVGTVRDGAKWPARDRRTGSDKRDRISFEVFSPLTIGRMITGSARMKELQEVTDRSVDLVNLSGTVVKRVLLRTAQKFYRSAIEMYLLEKVLANVESALDMGARTVAAAVAVAEEAVFSERWVDIGGQMMGRRRLDDLCDRVEAEQVADLDGLNRELDRIQSTYGRDEWAWVRWAYEKFYERSLDDLSAEDLIGIADSLSRVQGKFLNTVLNDAAKEFDAAVRTGFAQDGTDDESLADFTAVRGEYVTNNFVQQINGDLAALAERVERFKQSVAGLE